MKDHSALAVANFLTGYNCAQAVACAFAEEMDMTMEQLARLSSSFGGGMGKMREVCGAVSGALMVLGVLKGYSDPENQAQKCAHYALVQDFAARFKAKHQTIICRELLEGIELQKQNSSEPEARTPEYYRTRPCAAFVETAAAIVDEMLAE